MNKEILHLAMGSVQAIGVDVTYAEYLDNVEWLWSADL
jgi:hypothetical protein